MKITGYSDTELQQLIDTPDLSPSMRAKVQAEANRRAASKDNNIYQTGATYPERMAMGASTSPEQSLAFLKRRYDDARMLPDGSLLYQKDGGWHAANPKGLDIGDTASWLKLIPEGLGGAMGVVGGAGAGPATALFGGALMATAGGELYDNSLRAVHGMEDDRTTTEYLTETGTNIGLEMVGGKAADWAGSKLNPAAQLREGYRPEVDEAFERNNVDPTTGMVVPRVGEFEAGLANNPLIRSGVPAVDDAIADNLMRRAGSITDMTTGQDVGQFLTERANQYVQRFTAQADENFEEVGRHLGDETFPLNNFKRQVNALVDRFSENPEWGDELLPKEIKRWQELLETNNQVSYNTINGIRQEVGSSLTNPSSTLLRNLDDAQRNQLYQALNSDLKLTASVMGTSTGKEALEKALKHYSEGRTFIDDDLSKIIGPNSRDPEQIVDYVVSKSKKGDTKAQVLDSLLSDEEKQQFSAALLRMRMQAKPGSPEDYSVESFLTRTKEMSPEANDLLFQNGAGDILNDTRIMAEASRGRKQFDNTSGTARALGANTAAAALTVGGLRASVGDLSGAADAFGMVVGPVAADALLQSKVGRNILIKLAKSKQMPGEGEVRKVVGILAGAGMSDEDAQEVVAKLVPQSVLDSTGQTDEENFIGKPADVPPMLSPQSFNQSLGPQGMGMSPQRGMGMPPQMGPQQPPMLNKAQLGPPPNDILQFVHWAGMQDYVDTVRSDGFIENYQQEIRQKAAQSQSDREQQNMMDMLERMS
jgi:hypothetical protein